MRLTRIICRFHLPQHKLRNTEESVAIPHQRRRRQDNSQLLADLAVARARILTRERCYAEGAADCRYPSVGLQQRAAPRSEAAGTKQRSDELSSSAETRHSAGPACRHLSALAPAAAPADCAATFMPCHILVLSSIRCSVDSRSGASFASRTYRGRTTKAMKPISMSAASRSYGKNVRSHAVERHGLRRLL